MLKLSNNPSIDTAAKLVVVAILMFAFVFVVMVPLYNVLCDALGINGKTSGEAYTSVQAKVDLDRTAAAGIKPTPPQVYRPKIGGHDAL